jgi:tetratricopeptide (TPR) repeat protein
MNVALRLDPLSAPVDSFFGRTYLWARLYSDALSHLLASVQRFPNFTLNHVRLAHLYTYLNRFDDAIAEETKAMVLSGIAPREALSRADALHAAVAANGPRGYWGSALEFSQADVNTPEGYGNSYGKAILFTRLGEYDRALGSLDLAFAERQLGMTEIAIEPAFDPLQSDTRFLNLLRRVGVGRPP